MGVVLIKWAWLKILHAREARLYLQPHHSKNPRSAPVILIVEDSPAIVC